MFRNGPFEGHSAFIIFSFFFISNFPFIWFLENCVLLLLFLVFLSYMFHLLASVPVKLYL